MPRAVILTALPVEYLAVRSHLSDLQEEMHAQGTIYERGKFTANGQEWQVGIVETGAGNAGAALEAERAIVYFNPDILFFVGIAGGIKDVAIGDVVAATKVYGYESGKADEQFSTRPALGQSSHALVQRARAEARKEEWFQRLSNLATQPRVFVAPIAAGEKVVASRKSELFQFLKASYNDAVAVEMEGFGFLSAAFAYPEIKAIVIRGISDLIKDKNEDSPESRQEPELIRHEKASYHASAFAFEILANTPMPTAQSSSEQTSSKLKLLLLYPNLSDDLTQIINNAVDRIKSSSKEIKLTSQSQEIDSGSFLTNESLNNISNSDIIFIDVTQPNFNSLFQIGYALGKNKKISLLINPSINSDNKEIIELGLIDSIDYKQYKNPNELENCLKEIENIKPLRNLTDKIDISAPIYVVNTLHKNEAEIRILSKIKKSKIRFRSFDPTEQSRLSIFDAIQEVKKSVAVVASIYPNNLKEYKLNNLRVALLSGIAISCDKSVLTFQKGESPIPSNYQELVKVYYQTIDVDIYIHELASLVFDAVQGTNTLILNRPSTSIIEKIDLGSPAAENEMGALAAYYVDTDSSQKTISGNARIVVGRKGTGKTALFLHIRDHFRKDRRNTVLLDLKPEGHQLQSLKDLVLDFLPQAVQVHVATAFWEYLLLLEICHKLLQQDRTIHSRDQNIYQLYRNLQEIYKEKNIEEEFDFSERMYQLVQKISIVFNDKYNNDKEKIKYLSSQEVTQLLYSYDLPDLREKLTKYLSYKNSVWILFDNIDKGWPTRGVTEADIIILRALLEATRKLDKAFTRKEIDCHSIVFIRNDVFELLVDQSSDRGKESKVSLDWTDRDLLKELLRLRIINNNSFSEETLFEDVWNKVSVPYIDGELTIDYLIERSLMRPRNLLSLVNYAKANAINLRHSKITEADIQKAIMAYSADIGNEVGLEIRDVFPKSEDILYSFVGVPRRFTLADLKIYLRNARIQENDELKIIEILFWFAFIGVTINRNNEEVDTFIYDVFYDMKKLKQLIKPKLEQNDHSISVCIHPAFCPFLDI
jgi:nucleoside phosphorylase